MRRSERRDTLIEWGAWGALGFGVGLLAGFALAEAVGGRAALGRGGPEAGTPGEQEGATPGDEAALPYGALELADQSA